MSVVGCGSRANPPPLQITHADDELKIGKHFENDERSDRIGVGRVEGGELVNISRWKEEFHRRWVERG